MQAISPFYSHCLHHSCDLISFLHGMVLHVLVAFHYLAEICQTFSARYNFTASEFLAGTVDINAVVRQYCRNIETKDQARMY